MEIEIMNATTNPLIGRNVKASVWTGSKQIEVYGVVCAVAYGSTFEVLILVDDVSLTTAHFSAVKVIEKR